MYLFSDNLYFVLESMYLVITLFLEMDMVLLYIWMENNPITLGLGDTYVWLSLGCLCNYKTSAFLVFGSFSFRG